LRHNVISAITSLLAILFTSLHHADDVVRGLAPGKFSNIIPIVVLAIWLYGTILVLSERRSGYIIVLVLSFLVLGVPVIHMTGSGFAGPRIINGGRAFFFVWTLVMMGATALLSVILSGRALWNLRRAKAKGVE
jgi:hypothetical protein